MRVGVVGFILIWAFIFAQTGQVGEIVALYGLIGVMLTYIFMLKRRHRTVKP